ncbi:hypothetical protein IAT38_006852 [Cryptococcus sp. DSM 104549]
MPTLPPPPTPWVPTRFTDESLLLDAEPIFDVSLGESEWGGEKTVALDGAFSEKVAEDRKLQDRQAPDMTLDLEDYLPEDSETLMENTVAVVEQRKEEVAERGYERGRSEGSVSVASSSEASSFSTSQSTASSVSQTQLTHKRMGSGSEQAAPIKKHRPRLPVDNDFFSRRLSDSNRRSSITHLSSMLPPPPPSSRHRTTPLDDSVLSGFSKSGPSDPSSSGIVPSQPTNNASRRLKASILAENKPREESEARASRTSDQPASAGSSSGRKSSALSRYLATSSVLAPKQAADEAEPGPTPSSSASGSQAPHVPMPPRPLSTTSTAPATTSPPLPVAVDERQPVTATQATNMNESRGSRRTSMGEKVVNFFSGLIRPPTPSGSSEKGCEKEMSGAKDAERVEGGEEKERRGSGKDANEGGVGGVRAVKGGATRTLTKPIPFSRPLHLPKGSAKTSRPATSTKAPTANPTRAPLQPTRTQPNALSLTKPVPPKFSTSDNKPRPKPYSRPATTSAFATAALARLPPPGRGASAAAQPVTVKDGERARDLRARRDVFERLAASSSSASGPSHAPAPKAHSAAAGLHRTVPLRGHTPGKSSALRAQQRAQFDEAVRAKAKEKEEREAEERRKKEEEEERAYKESRKGTVIWAKPVPEMYRGGR